MDETTLVWTYVIFVMYRSFDEERCNMLTCIYNQWSQLNIFDIIQTIIAH